MNQHAPAPVLSELLSNAARTAGRIRSLAVAAEVVKSGSCLQDRREIENVVIDLLDLIADLAQEVESYST